MGAERIKREHHNLNMINVESTTASLTLAGDTLYVATFEITKISTSGLQ